MTAARAAQDGIQHVVLLMMENHSFDQMLGALQEVHPDLDGVTAASAQTRYNLTLTGQPVYQQATTVRQMAHDPKHEHVNVLAQLANGNGGFVTEFELAYQCSEDDLRDVMGYYPLDFLPALHALGREFTVCDRWFSSLPGPTWPNRFFALSGTCAGQVDMPAGLAGLKPEWYTEQSQATLFDRLGEQGIDWNVFYYDFPCSLVLKNQRLAANLGRYAKVQEFFRRAQGPAAAFPQFCLIEPQYFGAGQNDDHPPHNVMKAEKLIADVYNALRSNPELWQSTLLVVVYDEHGGFYDHVEPPAALPPDDLNSRYAFDRYGVRVPALLVSPRCARGVNHTQFDHTSLLKYLSEKWGLGPLGQRTAAAGTNSIGTAIQADLLRDDTPGFVRVPTTDLIPDDAELEKDASNQNQDALHRLADFLLAGGDRGLQQAVALAADAAEVGNWWMRAKHTLGRGLSAAGAALSGELRAARRAREARTAGAVERLQAEAGMSGTGLPPLP